MKRRKSYFRKYYRSERRKRERQRFFNSPKGFAVVFFSVIAFAAIAALSVRFIIIPALDSSGKQTDIVSQERLVEKKFRDIGTSRTKAGTELRSLSGKVEEAELTVLTAIDPYICGEELAFVSSSVVKGKIYYNRLFIYNCTDKTQTEIEVSLKYNNILCPRFNEDYIVFLDSLSSGGGRICVYDRKSGTQYALKDYLYSAPELSLDGNILAFMQQAGDDTDRLYFADISTRDAAAYRVFSGLPAAPSNADIRKGTAVYAVSYCTDDGFSRSRVNTLKLSSGAEKENEPGKLIEQIKTNGSEVAFLSSPAGLPTDLYMLEDKTPRKIAQDVVNFDMGDDFIAYTKDDNVYVYQIKEKTTYQVNSEISRGCLMCVNGKMLCFADVTGGFDDNVNTLKYIEVSFPDV